MPGGEQGIQAIAPRAKDLKTAGNRVVSILGADAESDLVREQAIRLVSDQVIVSALVGALDWDQSHVVTYETGELMTWKEFKNRRGSET